MANEHRRLRRIVHGVYKKLKRGEIPLPPEPRMMTDAEQVEFKKQMEQRRVDIQARLKSLAADSSRRGHKERLRLDQELTTLNEIFPAT